MQIFVYEYTCASSCWASLPESVRAEGKAMLSALLGDFAKIENAVTCTLLAPDFPGAMADRDYRHQGDETKIFCRLAEQADLSLIIAPEFDDLLATRCPWVEEAGGRSINCSLGAIELTADKLKLAGHLRERGVRTPLAAPEADAIRLADTDFPGVMKPRWGAGCQSTFLVNAPTELIQSADELGRETQQESVYTPYVHGTPASVSFLVGPGRRLAVPPATQHIIIDNGRFRYQGGQVPLAPALAERAETLADRALQTIEGLVGRSCTPSWPECNSVLLGWVGVDLVLGDADDGSGDYVIEINPRLTTSYVGLRRICKRNLAEALLRVAGGEEVHLQWSDRPIRFDATGKCD